MKNSYDNNDYGSVGGDDISQIEAASEEAA